MLTVPRPQPQLKQEGPWQPDDVASRQLLRGGLPLLLPAPQQQQPGGSDAGSRPSPGLRSDAAVGGGAPGSLSVQRASQPSPELGQLKRIVVVTPEAALPLALDPVLTFQVSAVPALLQC